VIGRSVRPHSTKRAPDGHHTVIWAAHRSLSDILRGRAFPRFQPLFHAPTDRSVARGHCSSRLFTGSPLGNANPTGTRPPVATPIAFSRRSNVTCRTFGRTSSPSVGLRRKTSKPSSARIRVRRFPSHRR
jgi:hypothetical protein